MLENHGGDFPFRMTELYEKVVLISITYEEWVKSNLLDILEEGYDFMKLSFVKIESCNQYCQEYALNRGAAAQIAILARTPQGKQLRKWLLDIQEAVSNYEYLSLKQVYFLIDLINAFSFVTNQKAIEEAHKNTFINDFIHTNGRVSSDKLYAKFHLYRNKALNIEPQTIKERVLRYYDEENKLVNKETKRDILAIIDKYSLIGNAAFDFMASIGKPSETALKVGKIVKDMADKMNVEIRYKNEIDLFHDEIIKINGAINQEIAPYLETPKTLKMKNK